MPPLFNPQNNPTRKSLIIIIPIFRSGSEDTEGLSYLHKVTQLGNGKTRSGTWALAPCCLYSALPLRLPYVKA